MSHCKDLREMLHTDGGGIFPLSHIEVELCRLVCQFPNGTPPTLALDRQLVPLLTEMRPTGWIL